MIFWKAHEIAFNFGLSIVSLWHIILSAITIVSLWYIILSTITTTARYTSVVFDSHDMLTNLQNLCYKINTLLEIL